MNPNRGGEQPAQHIETLPPSGQEVYSPFPEQAIEAPRTPESSSSNQTAPAIVIPAAPSTDDDTAAILGPLTVATNNDGSNLSAADANKIEKQWIEKAKAIIAQTKDDPFTQKNEMSKIKAAYIEKRFNKKLRVDDAKV